MSEHHSSRRAKRHKQEAGRSQKLRDKKKEEGVPTTHQLNRALVEGFFYELARQWKAEVSGKDAQISAYRVFRYAHRILTAKANAASRYDKDATSQAIRQRIKREFNTPFAIDFLPKPKRDDNTGET